MSDFANLQGVVQTQRRTWDKEVYMKKAIERELQLQAEEVEPLARKKPETRKADPNVIDLKVLKPAQARTQDLKLEETEGGFFCKTCGVQLKDSQSYLDHINGKKRMDQKFCIIDDCRLESRRNVSTSRTCYRG